MTARRFHSLIEASNDIVVILDAGGLFRYATPSTSRILRYPSEEMIGKHVVAFAHPVDAPTVAEALQAVSDYAQGGSATIELRVRHRDGSWRNMTASFTNLLERPSVNGIVINYQDVTERKRIEGQLFQSQKMEAIGRLAGGVAHDFNNLLTVILGNCGLILSDRHIGKATLGLVEQIRRAGERAASLTGQLLTFSRKHATEVKALDLNSVVRNMEAMLRRMIGEHINLKIVASRALGNMKVDLGQMEQIVLNLVVNAHDAMERGGMLTIETRNVHRGETEVRDFVGVNPGNYVMLMVSDDGEGMNKATRDRVFEPFFTTKEQGHGTGLGLSTVHGIVTQAGGHISLDSELGRGTVFKIYFPKSKEGIDTADPTPNESRSKSGSETILLVEDDEMVRDLAHHVLLREGYVVLTASRGSEALEICERYSEPIHLLVTDVVMPGGLNGYQTAGQVVSQRPEMAVLYISGYVDEAIVKDQGTSAQSTFLQKPFIAETLSRSVRDVLDGITGGHNPG